MPCPPGPGGPPFRIRLSATSRRPRSRSRSAAGTFDPFANGKWTVRPPSASQVVFWSFTLNGTKPAFGPNLFFVDPNRALPSRYRFTAAARHRNANSCTSEGISRCHGIRVSRWAR